MRIDPQVRALRGRLASQRDAPDPLFAALEAWRADPKVAPVLAELAAYGQGRALDDCPELGAAMQDADQGRSFVASLMERLLTAMRAEPLGQVPLRQFSGQGVSTLLLAREGGAIMLLSAREAGEEERSAASFSNGERHEIVLAGEGEGRLVRLAGAAPDRAQLDFDDVPLQPPTSLSLDQSCEALLVERVTQRLVTLRLIRTEANPLPTREFRLSDGAFIHQASGDVRESRHELMLALLGRMGRVDAVPIMLEMSFEGSEHLRWQTLRECLALDTATGFRALSEVARDRTDPLAGAAATLRAQLLEAYPALAQLETA